MFHLTPKSLFQLSEVLLASMRVAVEGRLANSLAGFDGPGFRALQAKARDLVARAEELVRLLETDGEGRTWKDE